jgi:hypothetical protein
MSRHLEPVEPAIAKPTREEIFAWCAERRAVLTALWEAENTARGVEKAEDDQLTLDDRRAA